MHDPLVLIDSSVWIDYIHGVTSETTLQARAAMSSGTAATCGVIRAELLPGARTEREYRYLAALLDELIQIPITDRTWERVAWVGFRLRRRGSTVPLTDLVIAAAAAEAGAEIIHCDAHFDIIAALDEQAH